MNCIRCGRRIAEGKTFCDECAGVVREPLPDSPYTSLHIALPKRTDQPRPVRKPVDDCLSQFSKLHAFLRYIFCDASCPHPIPDRLCHVSTNPKNICTGVL